MKDEVITKNVAETQKFAEEFAKKMQPGDIITLSGDLGAGKTTFTQGFAQGLGIKNRIISPTFVIVRSYGIKNHQLSIRELYHIDLYRIHAEKDLRGLGLSDLFADKEAITIIEWPERLGVLLPTQRWEIHMQVQDETTRKISLSKKIDQ